jgi:hypothetical protein
MGRLTKGVWTTACGAIIATMANCVSAVAENTPSLITPPQAAAWQPRMPSNLFVRHFLQHPGDLTELQFGLVTLTHDDASTAIFATWDEFEAYALCIGDLKIPCDVTYMDYEAGTIRAYSLSMDEMLDMEFLRSLSHDTADSRGTEVTKAVRVRSMPTSTFARRLMMSTTSEIKVRENGLATIKHPEGDYPSTVFMSGRDSRHSACAAK